MSPVGSTGQEVKWDQPNETQMSKEGKIDTLSGHLIPKKSQNNTIIQRIKALLKCLCLNKTESFPKPAHFQIFSSSVFVNAIVCMFTVK